MADLELLEALNTGANMVTTVASTLGIAYTNASQQLNAATARGLVIWQDDEHHLTDIADHRRFVRLSTAGLKELHRLRQAPTEG